MRQLCFVRWSILLAMMTSLASAQTLERDVAIVTFVNLSKASELDEFATSIPEWIFTDLANDGRLSLVDRSMLDATLEEMMLADQGIVDPGTAAQVGLKVGARNMFIGKLSLRGLAGEDPNVPMVISTQLIDVETSRVVSGWKVTCDKRSVYEQAEKLAHNIVSKIFPMSLSSVAFRSLLLPGWGQLSNGRRSGYAFIGLEALALGGVAWTQLSYQSAQDDLDTFRQQEILPGAELKRLTDQRDSRATRRNVALALAAGVWTANLLDSWIGARGQVKRHERRLKRLEVSFAGEEALVTWRILER